MVPLVAMRRARPSATAVLPTPASPSSSGLFLRRRARMWHTRRTSSARPTTCMRGACAGRGCGRHTLEGAEVEQCAAPG